MRQVLLAALLCGCAHGDGGMVAPPGGDVMEYGQVAVVRDLGGREELNIATEFQAYSGFAWIVPLPARPEVDSAQAGLFRELWSHCRPLVRSGGYSCSPLRLGPGYGDETGRGVEELEGGVIGDWEWTLFRATEPDTLVAYLDSLGYELPRDIGRVLGHYTDQGWDYFVVCRVREGGHEYFEGNVGIRLTFDSDSLVFPLHISRISTGGSPVTLYVLAEHRQVFGGARLKFSGRVDETTFPDLPGFVTGESHLTRLYRYFEPEEMEDIVLRDAPDDGDFRDVEVYGSRGDALPVFAMLAAALFARRRRRN